MKIHIDERMYHLTHESIQAILVSVERLVSDQYEKLPPTVKLAAMAGVRAILAYAESRESDPARKKELRPVRGVDPTLHLVKMLLKAVGEALPHVECEIGTTNDNTISNFTFKHEGEGRGQVSAHGDIGEWEDYGGETTGQEAR